MSETQHTHTHDVAFPIILAWCHAIFTGNEDQFVEEHDFPHWSCGNDIGGRYLTSAQAADPAGPPTSAQAADAACPPTSAQTADPASHPTNVCPVKAETCVPDENDEPGEKKEHCTPEVVRAIGFACDVHYDVSDSVDYDDSSSYLSTNSSDTEPSKYDEQECAEVHAIRGLPHVRE